MSKRNESRHAGSGSGKAAELSAGETREDGSSDIKLRRYEHNPILTCLPDNSWESQAVFNPAAILRNGKVHLLYRAVGDNGQYVSRLGYATSSDGFTFNRESDQPAFSPERTYERWSIEDPRIVELEGNLNLTYVVLTQPPLTYGQHAFTALASTRDFRRFRRHGIITPRLPGVDDRDTVLFPERIENQYVMLHRPQTLIGRQYSEYGGHGRPSSIWISCSDNLRRWSPGRVLLASQYWWEAKKIGMGPPPMKTTQGWLLIYHGVDAGGTYRTGAVLLALQRPERVIARLPYPILEPQEAYERNGDTPRVVFPTGMVLLGEQLLVYYGAADKVCAVAIVDLEDLLDALSDQVV